MAASNPGWTSADMRSAPILTCPADLSAEMFAAVLIAAARDEPTRHVPDGQVDALAR
jgi:hypothetical protein